MFGTNRFVIFVIMKSTTIILIFLTFISYKQDKFHFTENYVREAVIPEEVDKHGIHNPFDLISKKSNSTVYIEFSMINSCCCEWKGEYEIKNKKLFLTSKNIAESVCESYCVYNLKYNLKTNNILDSVYFDNQFLQKL
jgi:hypothetical protein